ncbi:helix-turn-helix domain-containing protein [Bacteroides fragilis]
MLVRIKDIMLEKGVSSVSLSEMIGVSKVTISNLINNKTMPSIDTLEKIATALGVEVWELFADPKKVKHSKGSILCPHCGKEIYIEVTTN